MARERKLPRCEVCNEDIYGGPLSVTMHKRQHVRHGLMTERAPLQFACIVKPSSAIDNYIQDMLRGVEVETVQGLMADASHALRIALSLAKAAGLKPEALRSAGGTEFRADVVPFPLGVEPSTGREVRIMFYNGADSEQETSEAILACVALHIQSAN